MAYCVLAVGNVAGFSTLCLAKVASAGVSSTLTGSCLGLRISLAQLDGSIDMGCLRFAGGVSSSPDSCNLRLAGLAHPGLGDSQEETAS